MSASESKRPKTIKTTAQLEHKIACSLVKGKCSSFCCFSLLFFPPLYRLKLCSYNCNSFVAQHTAGMRTNTRPHYCHLSNTASDCPTPARYPLLSNCCSSLVCLHDCFGVVAAVIVLHFIHLDFCSNLLLVLLCNAIVLSATLNVLL